MSLQLSTSVFLFFSPILTHLLGPANENMLHRSLNMGSVITEAGPISARTVAWPIQVARTSEVSSLDFAKFGL